MAASWRGRMAGVVLGIAALWLSLRGVARRTMRVAGASMEPTLRAGDLVIVRSPDGLRRGDIAVVRDPRDRERATVKRVTGLPGDVAALPGGPGPVPPGHVAVEGDNPTRSTDSRSYGPVRVIDVVGRVAARVWPPARLRHAA